MRFACKPDVTGPRSNLAGILEQFGQTEQVAKLRAEELQLLARDAVIGPNVGIVQYRYGLALYLNNKFDEAAEVLKKACELEPEAVEYRYMLAALLQKLDRLDEALTHSEQLLKLQPGNQSFRQLRDQLLQSKR